MNQAVEFTLAALIALTTQFNQGLIHLKQEEFAQAIPPLTAVIEANPGLEDLRDQARFYRAKAYLGDKQIEKAHTELAGLIRDLPSGPLRNQAFAFYQEIKGDLKRLVPRQTPRELLLGLVQAGKNEDEKAIRAALTPKLLSVFDLLQRVINDEFQSEAAMLIEIAQEMENGHFVSQAVEKDGSRARLMVREDNAVVTFELLQVNRSWRFNHILDVTQVDDDVDGLSGDEQAGQVGRVKQVAVALQRYANKHEGPFPKKLADLKAFIGDPALLEWSDPRTKKKRPYIYRTGLDSLAKAATMLLATPEPFENNRIVVFADGHLEIIPDEVFLRRAREQNWHAGELVNPEEVQAAMKQTVADLIERTQQGNFKERREARQRLKDLKDQAYPVIEGYKNHADPEVRMTVREVLGL